MANGAPTLPLQQAEVEETLRPLVRARMMPAAAFTDPRVIEWELTNIFGGWICAAHHSALAQPGDFIARELEPESFFVIAGDDGEPRALVNVCRRAWLLACSKGPAGQSG